MSVLSWAESRTRVGWTRCDLLLLEYIELFLWCFVKGHGVRAIIYYRAQEMTLHLITTKPGDILLDE